MNLQNMKNVFNDFKGEVGNQQILTNQYLSEDINKLTKMYESPDNILTRLHDKGLLVKKYLTSNKRRY